MAVLVATVVLAVKVLQVAYRWAQALQAQTHRAVTAAKAVWQAVAATVAWVTTASTHQLVVPHRPAPTAVQAVQAVMAVMADRRARVGELPRPAFRAQVALAAMLAAEPRAATVEAD